MYPQDLGGIFQEESGPSPPEESKRTYIKQEKRISRIGMLSIPIRVMRIRS